MKLAAHCPCRLANTTRRWSHTSDRRHQVGLTLVELMVALVLGLLLVGGVLSVFVANREVFRSTENLNRIQENARTAFDLMARDIREAGQNPCGTPLVANVIRDAAGNIPWWADWNKGTLIGVEGDQDRADIKAFGTTATARVEDTDAVIVIRSEQNEKIIDTHNKALKTITLTTDSTLKPLDIALICDLKSAAIFQVYDESSSGKVIDYRTDATVQNCSMLLGYPTPENCPTITPPENQFSGSTSPPAGVVTKLVASFWYIGFTESKQRALYRTKITKNTTAGVKTVTTEPEEMVPGVQDMQMEYLTSSGGTLASDWVTADNANFNAANKGWTRDNANQVVAVRITMTLQSEENIGTNQQPIQRKLIHVVALRSRDYLF